MCSRLVKQIATAEGITEQLKAENQMEWVVQMNNIRSRATEIVNADLIFFLKSNGGREFFFSLPVYFSMQHIYFSHFNEITVVIITIVVYNWMEQSRNEF